MSTVYVYPSSGTSQVIVQDGRLCQSFEDIDQQVINQSEFSRFIQMWRKRVNMRSRIDFEFNLPGLALIGLMPDSPMAIHVEIINPDSDEPTYIKTITNEKMATTKTKKQTSKTSTKASDAEASTKAPAARKPGREPQIDCEPAADIKEPRVGSMKALVLRKALSKSGVTIDTIEKMYEDEFAKKKTPPKTPARVRAFEILKLLNTQNGYGFETEGKKIFAITE